jgi:bifunctional DNase/RNase
VVVGGVGYDEANRTPVILLEETDGGRVLPIWIGVSAARSIAREIESAEAPRPNTHDLTQQLLSGLGARVLRATVTELRGSTYYATLRVESKDRIRDFDARPSDAIAVALRFDAPLFVLRSLFDARAGVRGDSRPTDERKLAPREPDSSDNLDSTELAL